MTHWNRLKFAVLLTVITVGILMVIDMIFNFNIGDVIFSEVFIVPTLTVAYLFAPLIGKYIKCE
jgi:hypothetical protein